MGGGQRAGQAGGRTEAPLEEASPGSCLQCKSCSAGASEDRRPAWPQRECPPGQAAASPRPGPGLLLDSGSTLSASVAVTYRRGVTVVWTRGVSGDGRKPPCEVLGQRTALVVVLSLGIVLAGGPLRVPIRSPATQRWACPHSLPGKRALVWGTPSVARDEPQHLVGVAPGLGVTPVARSAPLSAALTGLGLGPLGWH